MITSQPLASAELARRPARTRRAWTSMDARQLVDHIEGTHHRHLWQELPRLSALLDEVRSLHGGPELDAVACCFDALRAEVEPHLLNEERVLFPLIRELVAVDNPPSFRGGPLRHPISVMVREHNAMDALLGGLRELTGGYTPPSDSCAAYATLYSALADLESDIRLHVYKENDVLFPMVERIA